MLTEGKKWPMLSYLHWSIGMACGELAKALVRTTDVAEISSSCIYPTLNVPSGISSLLSLQLYVQWTTFFSDRIPFALRSWLTFIPGLKLVVEIGIVLSHIMVAYEGLITKCSALGIMFSRGTVAVSAHNRHHNERYE